MTRQVHVVPEGFTGRHQPFSTCPCAPTFLGADMTEPTMLVFRHRGQAAITDELPPVLRSTLEAYRGGATTVPLLSDRLGISRTTARGRLDALLTSGLLDR